MYNLILLQNQATIIFKFCRHVVVATECIIFVDTNLDFNGVDLFITVL